MRQSHAILIDAPVEEVFAFTEDEANAPEWAEGIVRFEITEEVPEGPGTKYRMVVKEGRSENAYDGEVLVWDENERTVNRVERGGMTMTLTRAYESAGEKTRVTMAVEVALTGGARLMAPLVWFMNRHFLKKQANALKACIENDAPQDEA